MTGWMNVAVRASASCGIGAGAYAPIPPVFGPVSPSPMRLWSWAMGSGRAIVPSHRAIRLHSGPLSRSSTTIGPRAARRATMASTVSASVAGTTTPLPAARPSCLTTIGAPSSSPPCRRLRRPTTSPGNRGDGRPSCCRQLAGVGLRRLESGELGGRPEARDRPSAALVGDAGGQRCLGADDDQIRRGIGRSAARKIGGDRHLVAVTPAGPGDGRLAAAGADHEDLHASTPSNDSLACASATSMG